MHITMQAKRVRYERFDGEFYNIIDTVNPSLERAKSLADLIEVSCEHNNFDSFEPDTLWRTAQAIRLEINDAQTLLNAYFEEIKTDNLVERQKSKEIQA